MKTLATIALAASLSLLSACGERTQAPAPSPGTASAEPSTAIGRAAKKGIDKAREKVRNENISISGDFHIGGPDVRIGDVHRDSGLPKAEITPQGDLLIEGRKVAVDPAQHALLVDYRGRIEQIAFTGMDIGVQGADLAGKAIGEAFAGIFSGKTDEIEQRVEAEADAIKASARQLCDQLPALYQTQQALAASLPEFRPYATMDQDDIDDCYRDDDHDTAAARTQAQRETREQIRSGIRRTVQAVAQGAGVASGDPATDAAAEADAAPAEAGTEGPARD